MADAGTRSAVLFANVRMAMSWHKMVNTVAISTNVMRCVVQILTERIYRKFLKEMASYLILVQIQLVLIQICYIYQQSIHMDNIV